MNNITNPANSYPTRENSSNTMGGGSKTHSINGLVIAGPQIAIEVLKYLGEKDQENFNLLSKTLHGDVRKYSHIKKQPFIQNTKSLINAINSTPYSDQSEHFKALLNKISSQKEGFLFSESASKFLEIKLQLLCLKLFTPDERVEIKSKITDNSPFYSFLENSDEKIIINTFQRAHEIKNEEYKFLFLIDFVDSTLEIAGRMTSDLSKKWTLEILIPNLTTPEQVDKALEIVRTMTDGWRKSLVLEDLIPNLTTPELVDKALEIVRTMTDDWEKTKALEALAPKLTTAAQIDCALDIAQGIADDYVKGRVLSIILPKITTPEQVDRALEIAGTMTDDWIKAGAIEALAPRLTTAAQIDCALDIAQTMTDDWKKAEVIEALAPRLTTAAQIGRALDIAQTMTDDLEKTKALEALAPKLTTAAQIDCALDIAGAMTHEYWKSLVLEDLTPRLKTAAQMYKLLSMSPLSICNLVSCKILTITSVGFCGALAAMTPFINAYYSGD